MINLNEFTSKVLPCMIYLFILKKQLLFSSILKKDGFIFGFSNPFQTLQVYTYRISFPAASGSGSVWARWGRPRSSGCPRHRSHLAGRVAKAAPVGINSHWRPPQSPERLRCHGDLQAHRCHPEWDDCRCNRMQLYEFRLRSQWRKAGHDCLLPLTWASSATDSRWCRGLSGSDSLGPPAEALQKPAQPHIVEQCRANTY